MVGRDPSAEELVKEVLADADFFAGTGGGVTFSGGEPMLQADFLFECAAMLRAEDVHVAVETAGLFPSRHVPELARRADRVLFDLKHCDPEKLRRAMGVDCAALLDTLDALLAADVEIELRVTVVPGFNADRDDLGAIARWLRRRTRVPPVTLQPFHRLAAAKAALHGFSYPHAGVRPPSDAALGEAARVLEAHGVRVARR